MHQTEVELNEAQRKIRKAIKLMNGSSILDMKYNKFNEFKGLISDAAVLMDKSLLLDNKFEKPLEPVTVIDYFDKEFPNWRSTSRKVECRVPRQILQTILATKTDLTLGEVALYTGAMDHTTVMNSKRVVSNMLHNEDIQYRNIFNQAIVELNIKSKADA